MKGRIVLFALLLLALTQAACAQIRLFPRKGRQEVLDTTKVAVPDSTVAAPVDSVAPAPVIVAPSVVQVRLQLPLGGSDEQKAGSMNFYEGFLLGLRQAAAEGIRAEVSVQECSEPVQEGPFHLAVDVTHSPQALARNVSACPDWTVVPLEQDMDAMADSCRVALVAGGWQARTLELVRWIREDWQRGDKLFVLSTGDDPKTEFLKEALRNEGLRFLSLSGNYTQQDYSIIAGTARFVLVAEDPGYTASAVNFLSGGIKAQKAETAFYCTSKVRSYARRFEEDALGNANTRMVTSYYVDYSAPAVDAFIQDFRRYYGAEPNQFAFHGYDTALYFVRLAAVYGAQWPLGLEKDGAPAHGLLTDFRFKREAGDTGFVNTAFRRISYDPDLNETISSTLAE